MFEPLEKWWKRDKNRQNRHNSISRTRRKWKRKWKKNAHTKPGPPGETKKKERKKTTIVPIYLHVFSIKRLKSLVHVLNGDQSCELPRRWMCDVCESAHKIISVNGQYFAHWWDYKSSFFTIFSLTPIQNFCCTKTNIGSCLIYPKNGSFINIYDEKLHGKKWNSPMKCSIDNMYSPVENEKERNGRRKRRKRWRRRMHARV